MSSEFKEVSLQGFNERKGFIVKVYSLLSLQLLFTFGLTLLVYLNQNLRNILVDPSNGHLTIFSWVCFGVMFATQIAIFCCKGVAKKVSLNLKNIGTWKLYSIIHIHLLHECNSSSYMWDGLQ